jgi:hypothetical protein
MWELMRDRLILFVLFASSLVSLPSVSLRAQVSAGELNLLHKLDSVSASPSVSAYFADLYFVTMVNAIRFFEEARDSSRLSIRRMQAGFAAYFFAAADSFAQQKNIPEEWKAYYADTSTTDLRHVLLGINAHINGDIWQALAQSFSYKELKEIRPIYFSYYSGLLDIYEEVYEAAYSADRSVRLAHTLSLGLDKWYGKRLLHRWLRRQMKIACLFHHDDKRFRKRLKKLKRKMRRMDDAIIRHF